MVVLIILNVTVVILETVRGIHARFLAEFIIIDIVSVFIFTVEYFLRIWVCTLYEDYSHPITGRIRFALTPYMIIDALAIFPFYAPLIIPMISGS